MTVLASSPRTTTRGRLSRRLGVGLALAAALLATSACKSSSSSTAAGPTSAAASDTSSASVAGSDTSSAAASATSTADCQKVRFALHAGLGVGAIHRYIYKPYKAGTFVSGASGRKTAFVKAALAGLFAVHELKTAATDIAGCPSVSTIETALSNATGKITGLAGSLHGGTANGADIASTDSLADSVLSTANAAGVPVQAKEPSALQIATGG